MCRPWLASTSRVVPTSRTRKPIRNGVTIEEIQEVLLQVAIYVGVPASLEAFRIAEAKIEEMKAAGEL